MTITAAAIRRLSIASAPHRHEEAAEQLSDLQKEYMSLFNNAAWPASHIRETEERFRETIQRLECETGPIKGILEKIHRLKPMFIHLEVTNDEPKQHCFSPAETLV